MFKFLHAADLHLDSSFRGLERYEGAPLDAMRHATRRALVNLVDLALEEKVHFVLLAGDLWDGDWRDYNSGLFFIQQMARLQNAHIPVVLIAGNHDAANRMTKSLRFPAGVTMLSTEEPETVELKELHVAIHGQSFATYNIFDDISLRYPSAKPGWFNIGLLHTSATGREGHERYAPCTVEGLLAKGYDYWALGHIHKREILHTDPLIVFPGNTQGRSMRETGPKGCMIVRVERNRASAEFQSLDVFRWQTCAVEVSTHEEPDAVVDAVVEALQRIQDENGVPMALRVLVRGATPAHAQLMADPVKWTNEVRSRTISPSSNEVWIERLEWQTEPPLGAMSLPEDGPIGELARQLAFFRDDPLALSQKCDDWFQELARRLPAELQTADGVRLSDPAWLAQLLEQVQPLLTRKMFTERRTRKVSEVKT